MTQSETFRARDDVVACELETGAALLDLNTSVYFSLNTVGAALWEAMKSPLSLEELSTIVAEKFDVAVDVCRADVAAYLKDLQARHLILVQQA